MMASLASHSSMQPFDPVGRVVYGSLSTRCKLLDFRSRRSHDPVLRRMQLIFSNSACAPATRGFMVLMKRTFPGQNPRLNRDFSLGCFGSIASAGVRKILIGAGSR